MINKDSIKYLIWKRTAAKIIANLLYCAWRDKSFEWGRSLEPEAFFEFEYMMSNHLTKSEWKGIVWKYFLMNVIGKELLCHEWDIPIEEDDLELIKGEKQEV